MQARALDLHVRQFRAFNRAGVATEFGVPAHWEVTTMAAVGRVRAAGPPEADADPTTATRQRRPADDLVWPTT